MEEKRKASVTQATFVCDRCSRAFDTDAAEQAHDFPQRGPLSTPYYPSYQQQRPEIHNHLETLSIGDGEDVTEGGRFARTPFAATQAIRPHYAGNNSK